MIPSTLSSSKVSISIPRLSFAWKLAPVQVTLKEFGDTESQSSRIESSWSLIVSKSDFFVIP